MLHKRHIPETDRKTFIAFISNSLSFSGVFVNHVQIRKELSKPLNERHPWVQAQMLSIDMVWKWVMQRRLIQCSEFMKWFINLNSSVMSLPCSINKSTDTFNKLKLGRFRDSLPGGNETSKMPFEEIPEKMNSIFSVLEKLDHEKDDSIMSNRVHFSAASDLAKAAWKVQFQIGYMCPFFQGNWASGRLLTNALRCHWSLPWVTFTYEDDDEKDETGKAYQEESHAWFKLFDEKGILTEDFV